MCCLCSANKLKNPSIKIRKFLKEYKMNKLPQLIGDLKINIFPYSNAVKRTIKRPSIDSVNNPVEISSLCSAKKIKNMKKKIIKNFIKEYTMIK